MRPNDGKHFQAKPLTGDRGIEPTTCFLGHHTLDGFQNFRHHLRALPSRSIRKNCNEFSFDVFLGKFLMNWIIRSDPLNDSACNGFELVRQIISPGLTTEDMGPRDPYKKNDRQKLGGHCIIYCKGLAPKGAL